MSIVTFKSGPGSGANSAGKNLILAGGQGTGSAAGGSILFQVADGGDAGSNLNALDTALTIADDKTATFAGNVSVTGTITGDTSLTLDTTTITTAEIGVLDGVTAGTATASKALVLDANKDIATIRNLTIDGTFSDGNYTFDTTGNVSGLGTVSCGAITSTGNLDVTGTLTGDTSLTLDSTTITTAEIGVLDGVTAGTATASKALVLDASKNIATIGTIGCGAITSTGDMTIFDDANNADTSLSIGTGANEALVIEVLNGAANKTAEEIKFTSKTESASADHGKFTFAVDETNTLVINDSGINVTGTITGDTSLTLDSTIITTAEIGVLDGVTAGTAAASKALVLDANKDIATIRNLTIDGTFSDGNYTFDTTGNVSGLGTVSCGAITSTGNLDVTGTITGDTSLTLDSTTITTAEIGVLDGVTAGTAAASKALVLDASKNIATIGTIACGAITSSGNLAVTGTITGDTSLTLDSTTITTAEIGVLDGVTAGTAAASKALVLDSNKDIAGIRNLSTSGAETKASAAGASWNALLVDNDLTLTGTTTVTSASPLNMVSLNAPTLADSNSNVVTVEVASTLYIEGSPVNTGSLSLNNSYSLFVDSGPTRLDGNLTVNGGGGVTVASSGGVTIGTSAINGILKLKTSNGNTVGLTVANSASNVTYTLPSGGVTNNYVLKTDGSGFLSWVAQGTGGTIDGLSDAKKGGSGFGGSLLLGRTNTGSLTNAVNNIGIGFSNTGTNTGPLNSLTDGVRNVAIGAGSCADSLSSGSNNTVIGFSAAASLTTGSSNVIIGSSSGASINTHGSNVVIGSGAGGYFTAENNTILGYYAGVAVSVGSNNTLLGSKSGNNITSGGNNTVIGYNAEASAADATNEITLGNTLVQNLRCADTTISSLSDARDKTDVIDLPWGLDFVDSLRPVQFTWDRRVLTPEDENWAMNGKKRAGFLAQELQTAMTDNANDVLDLVYESNPERLEVKMGKLVPMLTQAIKELKAEVDTLKAEVAALKNA